MSYVRIWVHLVYAVKEREPLLQNNVRPAIIEHIKKNTRKKDIFLDAINGHVEHLHCLISLGREQSIAKVAQLIKGESARWINLEKIVSQYFHWQDDYYAISVSESQVNRVRAYIYNQEAHHKRQTWEEEEAELFRRFGWEIKGIGSG